jgi:hypothetical protein
MNGYAGTAAPPGGMYVRALFDYDADDHTSLSFRRGDIIQVITQLESGWWDGIINNVRGWFPSNYCQVITGPVEDLVEERSNGDSQDGDSQQDSQDDYEDLEYEDVESERNMREEGSHLDGSDAEQEEAAFWIPQATPEGRLYYFNTLTGVSTMELPLETPTASNENGPRDRNNVNIPESTRPPPERMAGGYEREDDTDYEHSGSDAEPRSAVDETSGTLVSNPKRKRRKPMARRVGLGGDLLCLQQSNLLVLCSPSDVGRPVQQSTPPVQGHATTSQILITLLSNPQCHSMASPLHPLVWELDQHLQCRTNSSTMSMPYPSPGRDCSTTSKRQWNASGSL